MISSVIIGNDSVGNNGTLFESMERGFCKNQKLTEIEEK